MTPHTCSDIAAMMAAYPIIRECDSIANGALRLSTAFYYPDTSQVDVFIEEPQGLWRRFVVSDFGQTSDMLMHLHIAPWGTKKRRQLVQEICDSLQVRFEDGRIYAEVIDEESSRIPDVILRVAQACMRISDLYMTKRLYVPSVYRDDVEEFIGDSDLQYESNIEAPGVLTRNIDIDFRVDGKSHSSLVQTISTGNSQVAHHICLEGFAKWHDMDPNYRNRHALVTVYDSSVDVFRPDDLYRFQEYSELFAFPADADRLAEVLAA